MTGNQSHQFELIIEASQPPPIPLVTALGWIGQQTHWVELNNKPIGSNWTTNLGPCWIYEPTRSSYQRIRGQNWPTKGFKEELGSRHSEAERIGPKSHPDLQSWNWSTKTIGTK